jgi:hypothetical protein
MNLAARRLDAAPEKLAPIQTEPEKELEKALADQGGGRRPGGPPHND